ncbi:MAG: phage tail fiber protein [Alphaproteobacteria bacterium]
MSISNATEADILGLYFTAVAIANLADNAAASPETQIAYALHTGDPGEAGDQTTSEAAYTSYDRVDVARSGAGHTVTVGSVSPDANVDFPAGTGGSGTASFYSTGKSSVTGAADIYWSGAVSPTIVMGDGITPRLTSASTITLD